MRLLIGLRTDACDVKRSATRRSGKASHRLTGLRRVWIAIALLAISLVATPAAAQGDCDYPDDWDDSGWFRRCIQEHRLDAWSPFMLHTAASSTGNPAIVQLLLGAGADPNAVDDFGRTPLHTGAENSNPVVASHLVAAGADPNALDNEGETPLHRSARYNENERVVARLLAAGADPLVERNDGRTPLHSALRYDAVRGVISVLVQAGAAENLTPLQLAALQDDAWAVTSLLAEGADPNVVDAYGWTSLHYAVPLSASGVVSALLEAGADPNIRTVDGVTALHLAARQGTSAVVSDLLGGSADPNATAGEEEAAGTSLHFAARWNDDSSVVPALLDGGADAAARDENGRRPVDFARGNDAMIGSAAYPRLLVTRPTALVAGRAATGDLEATDGNGWGFGYYDEWTYSAVTGQRVVITMDSEDVDAYLVVLQDDGTEVASDDDGGTDYNARVEFRARATEQYTILAASLFSETTGRYVIRVERATAGTGASAQAGSSAAGERSVPATEGTLVSRRTFSGSLSSSDAVWNDDSYYDRWTFSARAGQRLVVTMESDDVDAFLRVVGRDGSTLESDDDSGSGTNARVEFEAPYTGEYFVIATSYGSGDTGSYGVR